MFYAVVLVLNIYMYIVELENVKFEFLEDILKSG